MRLHKKGARHCHAHHTHTHINRPCTHKRNNQPARGANNFIDVKTRRPRFLSTLGAARLSFIYGIFSSVPRLLFSCSLFSHAITHLLHTPPSFSPFPPAESHAIHRASFRTAPASPFPPSLPPSLPPWHGPQQSINPWLRESKPKPLIFQVMLDVMSLSSLPPSLAPS